MKVVHTRAKHEFVAFLDQDDLWHPEKLSAQMAHFARRPRLGLCVTHVQNFWAPELQREAERFQSHRLMQPLPGYLTQTLLARRELHEVVGPLNANLKYGDSTDWFLRAIELQIECELLPEVLVWRRLHNANLSRRFADASRDEYVQIIKNSLDRRRRQPGRGVPALTT